MWCYFCNVSGSKEERKRKVTTQLSKSGTSSSSALMRQPRPTALHGGTAISIPPSPARAASVETRAYLPNRKRGARVGIESTPAGSAPRKRQHSAGLAPRLRACVVDAQQQARQTLGCSLNRVRRWQGRGGQGDSLGTCECVCVCGQRSTGILCHLRAYNIGGSKGRQLARRDPAEDTMSLSRYLCRGGQ